MNLTARTRTGRWVMSAVALVATAVALSVLMTSSLAGQTAAQPTAKPQAATPQTTTPQTTTPPTAAPQRTTPQTAAPSQAGDAAANARPEQGVTLDRLVAVVNGDVILESDVDEERRLEEVQPFRTPTSMTRDRIIERLIDRSLILQQAALQPEDDVSDKDVDAQLAALRKDIPSCKQYNCESDEGWKRYLGDHGLTEEEFRARWKQRMQLLKFIEARFRNGIKISDADVKEYYEKNMAPEYAKRNVTPPKLETIQNRIEEVLLQQQVGALLQDWLKSLRAQGSVRTITPGEVTP